MTKWKVGGRGRPPKWAIEQGIVNKNVKKSSKSNTPDKWRPGSSGRPPTWYVDTHPIGKMIARDPLLQ